MQLLRLRYVLIFGLTALLAGGLSWGLPQFAIAQDPPTPFEQHRSDLPVPSPQLAIAPAVPVDSQSVTYGTLYGRPSVGFLARPADAEGPLPALIVIHEWWGLNENIKAMTEKLAGEGYTALAVDLYGGKVAETPDRARELVTAARENPDALRDNLRDAYRYLEEEENAPTIASIGWCFGGTWSLNTALLFPEQLDAAVIYYGGGIETDPEKLKTLEMPILGIFGELDDNPSPETAREFESTLKDLGKSVDVYIYENADHAFANPSGTRYNPEAAADASERTLEFLNRHLK
ncbi:dienelactone hydrolase family protein [Lyngbya sp. CCY1209]|uniref:dienelactone hydrolase family protein n=1 Tax=Lyngbya sp. CCY1209 TaxID=2886103 RepID=UPI002D1FD239|nr:dienelactone hydrolase family protein [Lyngbya sp. CCY1209]MEB3882817.1 dienelactone hydrolase family protein [Lyngbya sp. CCY1209]